MAGVREPRRIYLRCDVGDCMKASASESASSVKMGRFLLVLYDAMLLIIFLYRGCNRNFAHDRSSCPIDSSAGSELRDSRYLSLIRSCRRDGGVTITMDLVGTSGDGDDRTMVMVSKSNDEYGGVVRGAKYLLFVCCV